MVESWWEPSVLIGLGPRPETARRFAPGFRSAARAARRPRSGRGWGRGTRLPAAPGSGFRSAARAARRPRSGRGWGRGTRLPAAPGSGFRSAARAARRPRSGRGWGRGTRLPAAPGSGIGTPLCTFGARRRVPIRLLLIVKGGNPLSRFPPKSPAANRRFAAICFLCGRQSAAPGWLTSRRDPNWRSGAPAREPPPGELGRPLVGIAAREGSERRNAAPLNGAPSRFTLSMGSSLFPPAAGPHPSPSEGGRKRRSRRS